MRLVISTPISVVVDVADVVHVRAEDPSGSFGILQGEEDLLTTLTLSVVSWRLSDRREGHCAVRGGVLTVAGGETVSVATREAVVGTALQELEQNVLKKFREALQREAVAHATAERLHITAIRQIIGYLRPERRSASTLRTVPASREP